MPFGYCARRYGDLAAYRMGGVIGYWYVEGFKRAGIKLQFVKRDEQNVKKLDAERIDAFITDELVGRILVKKVFPGKEGEFNTVEKPDGAAALYVIVRKGNAAGEAMVASLNAGLLKLKESGELKQIVAKYVR
jgi:ABC-type amino acid transport substrate-binding protein